METYHQTLRTTALPKRNECKWFTDVSKAREINGNGVYQYVTGIHNDGCVLLGYDAAYHQNGVDYVQSRWFDGKNALFITLKADEVTRADVARDHILKCRWQVSPNYLHGIIQEPVKAQPVG